MNCDEGILKSDWNSSEFRSPEKIDFEITDIKNKVDLKQHQLTLISPDVESSVPSRIEDTNHAISAISPSDSQVQDHSLDPSKEDSLEVSNEQPIHIGESKGAQSVFHELQAMQPPLVPVDLGITTYIQPSPVTLLNDESKVTSHEFIKPASVQNSIVKPVRKNQKSKVKFNETYFSDPKLKPWVRRVVGDPFKAQCIFCRTTLNCGRHVLYLHRSRKVHINNEMEFNKKTAVNVNINKPVDVKFETKRFLNFLKYRQFDTTSSGNVDALMSCITGELRPNRIKVVKEGKNSSKVQPTNRRTESVGHYTLKRDKHCLSVLDQLLDDDVYADVTLTAEGQYVKAHKAVLCQSSNYFRRLFGSQMNTSSMVVAFCDIKILDLRSIVGYLYTGETTIDANRLDSFMHVAEMLEISTLCESGRSMSPSKFGQDEKPVNKTFTLVNENNSKSNLPESHSTVNMHAQPVEALTVKHISGDEKICNANVSAKLDGVRLENVDFEDASNASQTSDLSRNSQGAKFDHSLSQSGTSNVNSRPKRTLTGVPIRAYSPFESSTKSSDFSDSDSIEEESSVDGYAKKSSIAPKGSLKKKGKLHNSISNKNIAAESPMPKKLYPKRKLKDDGSGTRNSDVSASSSTVRKKYTKKIKSDSVQSNEMSSTEFSIVKSKSSKEADRNESNALRLKKIYKKKKKN